MRKSNKYLQLVLTIIIVTLVFIIADGFNIITIGWIPIEANVLSIKTIEYPHNSKIYGTTARYISNVSVEYTIGEETRIADIIVNKKLLNKSTITIRYNPSEHNEITGKKVNIFIYVTYFLLIVVSIIITVITKE